MQIPKNIFNSQGVNPTIKKKTLAKLIELKESYVLCDIWRVRNMKFKRFIFAQKHSSGFIQCRLAYLFISNTLEEFLAMTEILTPILTDHSHVLFSYSKEKGCLTGKGIWTFNSSLIKDENYITKIKEMIHSFCTTNKSFSNFQLKWEL